MLVYELSCRRPEGPARLHGLMLLVRSLRFRKRSLTECKQQLEDGSRTEPCILLPSGLDNFSVATELPEDLKDKIQEDTVSTAPAPTEHKLEAQGGVVGPVGTADLWVIVRVSVRFSWQN